MRPGLACLTPSVPHARVTHAGGVLLHHRLLALAEHYDVVVMAPRTPDNEAAAAHVQHLPVVLAEWPTRISGRWATAAGLAKAASGRLDSSVPRLRSAVLSASVADLLARQAVVEVHGGEYLPLLPLVAQVAPHVVRGVFLHDVLTEARAGRVRNRLVLARASCLPARQRCRPAARAPAAGRRGRRVRPQAAGRRPPALGVPVPSRRRPAVAPAARAGTRSRTGAGRGLRRAMWREENAKAALWLAAEVWPQVRRRVPTAELRLVGARPSPRVAAAAEQPGVIVTGFVDDLDAEYRRARVALAPLDTDTGLKVKVPQAMAYGLPVVGRPEALVGVADAPSSALGGSASEPGASAALVADLLVDDARVRAVGRAARCWVQQRFDYAADVTQTVDAYRDAAAARVTRPGRSI